jgi:hypothetical protein
MLANVIQLLRPEAAAHSEDDLAQGVNWSDTIPNEFLDDPEKDEVSKEEHGVVLLQQQVQLH